MNWLPIFGNKLRIVPINRVTPTKCINYDTHGTCIMITWKLKNCPLIANEETTATGVVLYIFATPVWNKAFRESIHENLSVILCWASWTWPSVKSHPLFCCRISHLILCSDGRGIYRLRVRCYGWHSGQEFKVRNIKSGCSTVDIVHGSIIKCDWLFSPLIRVHLRFFWFTYSFFTTYCNRTPAWGEFLKKLTISMPKSKSAW